MLQAVDVDSRWRLRRLRSKWGVLLDHMLVVADPTGIRPQH
jgi:hypothetical protein